MPNYVQGDSFELQMGATYDYTYPLGLDLKPGSRLHSELIAKILLMARDAKAHMEQRYDQWQKVDKTLSAYISKDSKDTTNVIVPMTYATMDTILTNWMTIFTSGPLFEYRGIGPEDKYKAMLLELVVDSQCRYMKTLLNLHTQFRDSIAYGLGVSSIRWEQRWGKKISPITDGPYAGGRETRRQKVYEANALDNWEVYNYIVDPNVASNEVQKGSYVGHISRTDYNTLLNLERSDPESYFNVKSLKNTQWTSTYRTATTFSEVVRKGDANNTRIFDKGDVLCMYITLIPKDWNLGKSEYPELWVFEIAGDKIIIRAQPTNLPHEMYPVSVACPTYDGHSISPVSILEMVYPLQETLDWFYRSHIHNVKSSLNNMLIVDPWLVNYNDVANPEPGKLIKIREHVWGRGVENAVKQLEVHDVTRTNVADMGATVDLLQRVTGAVDALQGIVRTGGERRSATEMRDTRLAALSRIQKQAMLVGMTAMQDIGYMFAKHIQQFMEPKTYLQIAGRNAMELHAIYKDNITPEGMIEVDPLDFICEFDVSVGDGSRSGGEYVTELLNAFQMIQAIPTTAQAFDPVRMMLDILRKTGIKGATDYLSDQYRFQIMPTEQAMNVAADKNMAQVPLESMMSQPTGMPSQMPTMDGQTNTALPRVVEDLLNGQR